LKAEFVSEGKSKDVKTIVESESAHQRAIRETEYTACSATNTVCV